MGSKLLQGIGVFAILALVGGSIAALLVVKGRIRVTIAAEEEAARRGPDPIDLLRDSLEARIAALEAKIDAQRVAAPASAAGPAKKTFLAFDLPTAPFAFDQRQNF